MRQYLFASTLATTVALTATMAAQNPQTQQPQTPPAQSQSRAEDARAATVEGCLMREADVPGREPNIVERAGIGEDYILTNAKVVKGTAPAPRTAEARPADTPIGTSGAQAMYEVEGIDDDRLEQHVGRRVQIDGTFENVDRAGAAPERNTPADDLVEIRGTAIRQVAGDCGAK